VSEVGGIADFLEAGNVGIAPSDELATGEGTGVEIDVARADDGAASGQSRGNVIRGGHLP
jgi:hypothetical protein